jgi:hypothetical protein
MVPLSSALLVVLVVNPAFGGGPISAAATREAERLAAKAPPAQANNGGGSGLLWGGVGLAAGGATLAILGGTALKKETTACVPDYFFGDICATVEESNDALVWTGIAVAGLGATLAVLGASRTSVNAGPGFVSVRHKVKFLRMSMGPAGDRWGATDGTTRALCWFALKPSPISSTS